MAHTGVRVARTGAPAAHTGVPVDRTGMRLGALACTLLTIDSRTGYLGNEPERRSRAPSRGAAGYTCTLRNSSQRLALATTTSASDGECGGGGRG